MEVILREVGAGGAHPAGCADRGAPAGLRHGAWRRGSVQRGQEDCALLLPADPDGSAAALRARLLDLTGATVGVIINDSAGRAWRRGTVGIALGAAGLPALLDLRGRPDLFGRALEVTVVGFADEIAAAASLLMGQADEARPVVRVRGLAWSAPAAARRRDPAAGGGGPVPMSGGAWSRCPAASAAPSWRWGWRACCRPRTC